MFLAWSDLRTTSGFAAVFILGNSVAGLLGNFAWSGRCRPNCRSMWWRSCSARWWEPPSGRNLRSTYIQRALGLVLIIAGLKLIGVY